MIDRPFWTARIHAAWRKRPIVWLAGVRRVGKTTLAGMLKDTVYMNCDLPTVERRLSDPEFYFSSLPAGTTLILDEIHRLPDPSRTLKIAADAYPKLRILATGSSTLAATRKFRDSLAGRKAVLVLPPVLWPECEENFHIRDLDHRLLHGGLPENLLSPARDEAAFSEWIDSFYARDIQELFGVRERTGFLKLFRLVVRQSGGLVDYSALARECEISRHTAKSYMESLMTTCTVFLLTPFHGGGRRELTRRPKAYAFDTGFVCHLRGWPDIRDEDRGFLWEHLVLDVLRTAAGEQGLFYWQDKSGHEVDMIIRDGRQAHAVECKINPDRFTVDSLSAFRSLYPSGRNYLICPGITKMHERRFGGLVVRVAGCGDLLQRFTDSRSPMGARRTRPRPE